jgi:hypothetical protein
MPRTNSIITSWTKGEVSPMTHGRVDVNLYANGAKTIENLIVRPQGPVFRRSGTKFVRAVKLQDISIIDVANSGGFYRLGTSNPTSYQAGDYITVTGTGTTCDGVVKVTGVTNSTPAFITTDEPFVSVSSVGRIVRSNRCIPFTVSDETAYMLEFGDRYIHFYKNKEPLFETTTTEVEKYTISTAGTYPQIDTSVDDDGDLPGWGDLSAFFIGPPADNGTVIASNNGFGLVRITTSVPHTLRSGVTVKMYQTANPSSLNGNTYVVDRISPYIVDLRASAFVSNVGVTDTAMISLGLMAGDRVFFSGGQENTLGETFRDVKSVDTYDKFTVANYLSTAITDTTPSNEEVHLIPIEVVTPFTENELADITYVQSADVLYLFHPNHPVQKLVRLDTDGDRNDWLLATVDFKDGPYLPLNDLSPNIDTTTPANGANYDDVYFEVSSYSHTANVTAAAAFGGADNNNYLEYRTSDQWRLAQLVSGQGTSAGVVNIIDNVLLYLDDSTRLVNKGSTPSGPSNSAAQARANLYKDNRTKVYDGTLSRQQKQTIDPKDSVRSSDTAAAAGTLKSQFSNTFSLSDVGKYIRYQSNAATPVNRWAKITAIPRTTTGTGSEATHAAAVTMVSNNATGQFVITGEVRTATVKSYRAGATFAAFATTDVGRMIRLGFGGRWTWGKITAFTSSSQVTVTFYEDMPRDPHNAEQIAGVLDGAVGTATTTGRTFDWRMGAWSTTTGYPSCGVFHEQRLWMAATVVEPNTMWGSISADFENMAPTQLDSTVLDDSAVTYTLGSTRANAIKWMISGPALTIGTSGGEWQGRASSSINDAITPSNFRVTEYTGHGSPSAITPTRIGSSILFADRSGEKVHELFYSYEKDAVDSDDVTVISEHILRDHGGTVATAFQQKPHSIFWVACADGTLSGMTFNKKQEVIAWHHHTIQGGLVKDIAVIPSDDASEDELWMVVERTINESTVRYMEVLESDFYPASTSSRLQMKFLDTHKYITGYTGTLISGLNYLDGQSVVVVRDGTRITGTFTVSSGAITISAGATTELLIGLLGNANLQSLPPEGGSPSGTSQGQMKRVVSLDGRFYNTDSISHGPSSAALSPVIALPTSPNWFTGTFRLTPAMGWDVESSWYVRQAEPYPLNLLFAVTKLETNE